MSKTCSNLYVQCSFPGENETRQGNLSCHEFHRIYFVLSSSIFCYFIQSTLYLTIVMGFSITTMACACRSWTTILRVLRIILSRSRMLLKVISTDSSRLWRCTNVANRDSDLWEIEPNDWIERRRVACRLVLSYDANESVQ